jgi:hypothetical protein
LSETKNRTSGAIFVNRRIFQFATLLLWLALPLVALQYRQVWDQLPLHVATHFNASGQANGWMSRDQALQFGAGFVAILLVIFTALLLYMARTRVDVFSWAMFGFCALIIGVMVKVNASIVSYNLHGTALDLGGTLIAIPIAAVLLVIVYVVTRRGPALSPSSDATGTPDLMVEETHSGGIVVTFFLLLAAVAFPLIAATMVPVTTVRVAMAIVALLGIAGLAAAWSGFQYRFLRHGVEIRTLGFRLRSIPRMQIQSYAPESWSPLRGYGMRGLGNTRAYVWGNKVVRIKTSNGDVILGHSDPPRIVRDLDLVMSTLHVAK